MSSFSSIPAGSSRKTQRRPVSCGTGQDEMMNGPVREVVDEEPEPIRHLRRYSSYLNPQPGLFSADTWTLVAIYLRNVLINLLLLLPMVLTGVVTIRLIFWLYNYVFMQGNPTVIFLCFGLGLLLAFIAFLSNAFALNQIRALKVKRGLTQAADLNARTSGIGSPRRNTQDMSNLSCHPPRSQSAVRGPGYPQPDTQPLADASYHPPRLSGAGQYPGYPPTDTRTLEGFRGRSAWHG